MPVLETFLRRHVTDEWPQHAEGCEFYREPAEQAEISASYQPMKKAIRLVRSFELASAAAPMRREIASSANRRPQLAALLVRLMTEAGLQRVGADGFKPRPLPEQMRSLWPVARGLMLDSRVRMADAMCMSVAKLPGLAAQIESASDADYPHTRPHGVLLVRAQSVGAGMLRTLNGEDLPVTGRMAVFGDRPEDEPGVAIDARSPYLALCIVARPSPSERAQVTAAYVHPCASLDRLMLVDSDAERHTLLMLRNFQYAMRKGSGASVTIDKPMDSLAPDRWPDGRSRPPVIPDFIVTVRHQDGREQRAVIETMGYADEGYRERKARLHPEMQNAASASSVINHDFQIPAHWQQDWRDRQFRRELWRHLGGPKNDE
ncbi:MAG: hypothetical protein KGH75_04990 [Rhodospirillales bacterium]|nr:hypothetical protein [Rhodospirillales bacterium]